MRKKLKLMRSILILSAKSYYATLAIKFSEDIPGKDIPGT